MIDTNAETSTVTDDDDRQTEPENGKHESKLRAARERLPQLSSATASVYDEVRDLNVNDLDALAQHLNYLTREIRTRQAVNSPPLKIGQTVRVVSGDLELIGKVGTVVKMSRIRCYVEVDSEQVYLYISDVTAISQEPVESPEVNESVAEASAAAI